MGVGLYLNGRYKPSRMSSDDPTRAWLTRIEKWFEEDLAGDSFWGNFLTNCRHGITLEQQPALFVAIHPAGEEVEFIVPEPGRILISAKTSTVGPGYHIALCDLARRFGEEMKVTWNPAGEEDDACQDETGYFFHGDPAAVEVEMFLHLRTIANVSLETLETTGFNLVAWNMPLRHSYSEYPGDIRTPMGVRSKDWIRAILENPRNGIDIYPWWEDGQGARFWLGMALCELWMRIRWRPALNEDEWSDWMNIHLDLCKAYEKDPTLDFPWREWGELMANIQAYNGILEMESEDVEPEVLAQAAKIPTHRPLIGYRRYSVQVDLLDGWSIRIPGAMAESWEKLTWCAWDGDRTVWFNNWGITAKDGSAVPAERVLEAMKLPDGELMHYRDGGLVGKAILLQTEENGEALQNLKAFSAVDGKSALCNIFYHDEKDFDWAVATWHSLTAK